MAQELEITYHHDPSLPDGRNGHCFAEKVVDVTEDCPRADRSVRCIFLYTRSNGGRILQISRPYVGHVYMGTYINIALEWLDQEMNTKGRDDFGSWAHQLGLKKNELQKLIEIYAPPV